jgi:4-hydroxy-tetrahydrodipicolinate reductase
MGIKVAVLGAKGRMGQEVCRAIENEKDLELFVALDLGDSIEKMKGADVMVDFTTPEAVMSNIESAIEMNIHAVIGTTGFTSERLKAIEKLLESKKNIGVLVAPNFGLGAVATRTAEIISDARAKAELGAMPDKTTKSLDGARGAKVSGIPIHSVRLRGLVAHQEVLFGDKGELLTIRHDSLDRTGFMPGIMLACRKVSENPGLTVGLENYLKLG